MSAAYTWGTQEPEQRLPFPCDRCIERPDAAYYRGITVRATPATLFRWLCQLRVAPYSYDWIDNGGRRSPRTLTPGLEDLAAGQSMMRIFSLVEFAKDRHLTLRIKHGTGAFSLFGDLAITYLIVPECAARCRLLVKLLVRYPPGLTGTLMRWGLPWGDLVMMRRQLLNLRARAESSPPRATRPGSPARRAGDRGNARSVEPARAQTNRALGDLTGAAGLCPVAPHRGKREYFEEGG